MDILEMFLNDNDEEEVDLISEFLRGKQPESIAEEPSKEDIEDDGVDYSEIDTIEELENLSPHQRLQAAKDIIERKDPFIREMVLHFPRLHRTASRALKWSRRGTKRRSKNRAQPEPEK